MASVTIVFYDIADSSTRSLALIIPDKCQGFDGISVGSRVEIAFSARVKRNEDGGAYSILYADSITVKKRASATPSPKPSRKNESKPARIKQERPILSKSVNKESGVKIGKPVKSSPQKTRDHLSGLKDADEAKIQEYLGVGRSFPLFDDSILRGDSEPEFMKNVVLPQIDTPLNSGIGDGHLIPESFKFEKKSRKRQKKN